jgi:hypothetical protein
MPGAVVLQFMYYSYFGPVAAICMIVGAIVAISKNNKSSYAWIIIAILVIICCSGTVWKSLAYLPIISRLVHINKTPTRMMMVFMIFAPCVLAVGMSYIKRPLLISSIILLFVTIDYTILCMEMSQRKLTFDKKYADSCKDMSKIITNAKVMEFLTIPGDSMYLLEYGKNASMIMTSMTNTFSRYLVMKNIVNGQVISCSNNVFRLPNNDKVSAYKLYLDDPYWNVSIFVSIISTVIFLLCSRKDVISLFNSICN